MQKNQNHEGDQGNVISHPGKNEQPNASFFIILGLMVLSGGITAWMCTPWGVKVGYDSQFYLSAAENFLKGLGMGRIMPDGKFIPLVHFPPLYPLYVAIFQALKAGDLVMAARWAAIVLYMLGIFLFGFTVHRYTHSTKWLKSAAGLLAAFFFMISPVILDVSLAAFSEGLYFVIMMLALLIFNEMLSNLEWKWIILAGVMAALGSLTRYVGVTLTVLGVIAIWFLSYQSRPGQTWTRKFWRIVVFGSVSILPLIAWYLRNWLQTGSFSNRSFGIHLPGIEVYREALDTLTAWFLPAMIPLEFRLLISALVLFAFAALIFLWLRRDRTGTIVHQDDIRFVILNILYIPIYLAMLWISRAFMDNSTRWETRILSPLWINFFFIGFLVIWNTGCISTKTEGLGNLVGKNQVYNPRPIIWKTILTSLTLVLIIYYAFVSFRFLTEMRAEGSGFASRRWANSQTIQDLKELPEEAVLYSNDPAAIYFLLGRPAYWIPERYDSVKDTVRQDYETNLAVMRRTLEKPGSYLVLFLPYRYQDVFPTFQELTEGLNLVLEASDGMIYSRVDPDQNQDPP